MRLKLLSLLLVLFLVVSCSDEEPAPEVNPSIDDFNTTIDENPAPNQKIGSINVIQSTGSLNFSLSDQNPVGALNINSQSGELSVADESLYNFEVNPVITALVTVTDDNGSATASVTINLNDINENTTFNIWSGPSITFTKAANADPNLAANQDRISASVSLTRGNGGGQIYNATLESSSNKTNSPAGTLWAVGSIENIASLTFDKFRAAVGDPKDVVGKNLILYLEAEDVYLPVTFSMWSQGSSSGGSFTYTRATEN